MKIKGKIVYLDSDKELLDDKVFMVCMSAEEVIVGGRSSNQSSFEYAAIMRRWQTLTKVRWSVEMVWNNEN